MVAHFKANDETTRTELFEAKITADPLEAAEGISPDIGFRV